MGQPALGIVTVFTLFILCMFLSAVINIVKIKYRTPPRSKKEPEPQIIYIDGNALKKATKHPDKKRVVPFEATLINKSELNSVLSGKNNSRTK